MTSAASERKPRMVARILMGAIALLIVWYLGGKVLSLFINSNGHRTGAMLTTEQDNPQNVQISLQGGEWQRGENNVKVYPGDAISTRGGGNAIITLFDGTRLRLDTNTEVSLERSDQYAQDLSTFSVQLRSGRLWATTPSLMAYSGSIMRTINVDGFAVDLPGETNALIGPASVTVLRAQGLGLNVELLKPKRVDALIVIGEGQQLNLSEEARTSIASGTDPYRFRDPISAKNLSDEFLLRSYALLKDIATGSGSTTTIADLDKREDLVVTSPEQNARVTGKTVPVRGRVSDRIYTLIINNSITSIKPDRSFSADVSIAGDSAVVHIEAQDEQGVALAKIDRNVKIELNPYLETVRMQSPTSAEQTYTTAEQEIDISGEAPPNAASIIVNDYKLQLYKAGSKTWSYLASRQLGNFLDGKNTFTIYAVDKDGRKGPPVNIYVVYDPKATAAVPPSSAPPLRQNPPLTPGTLAVTTPVAGTAAEIDSPETVIEGTTSAQTASISVNGYTLSLYVAGKTTWNYIASKDLGTLKQGKNVYRIVSRNSNGEILDVLEYTITYTPKP